MEFFGRIIDRFRKPESKIIVDYNRKDSHEQKATEEKTLDPIINKNVDKLFGSLIDTQPNFDHGGVLNGESAKEPGGDEERRIMRRAIKITYDAFTGEIKNVPDEGINAGYFRILRTYLISQGHELNYDENKKSWVRDLSKNPKYLILLAAPPGELTSQQLNRTIQTNFANGNPNLDANTTPVKDPDMWYLPEIIDPKDKSWYTISGEPVPRDHFTKGDEKLYASIQEFNRKYGPDLSQEFFGKLNRSRG
jgi:hypothetical protein